MATEFNPLELRELILNVRTPIVIKNLKIPWKCFTIPLQGICFALENYFNPEESGIPFEVATKKGCSSPQWEKFRDEELLRIEEILDEDSDFLKENYACLSYRNILELPLELREDIKFSDFGFPDLKDDDTTFWLSTKNCNTPCHYDTYGCNVVVQVVGRKSWLLFPPNAPLSPVRIPYEESSVYCSENFYSPKDMHQFDNLKDKCYRSVLEPGDVLVIPKNWWHFVETLETSISFNHWIPVESDLESQLDECLVKYLIEKFITGNDELNIANFLNPNQISAVMQESEVLNILEKLCKDALQKKNETDELTEKMARNTDYMYPYLYLSELNIQNTIEKLEYNIQYVNKYPEEKFLNLMQSNSSRFNENLEKEHKAQDTSCKRRILKEILINSVCNPNVIKNIKNILLENFKKCI